VKKSQGIQGGGQHLLHFVGSKSPLEQDLREGLFGVFHYDEEKLAAAELAQTCIEKPNQMRVRQLGSRLPVGELSQCDPLSRDDLDRGRGGISFLAFREEYRAVV